MSVSLSQRREKYLFGFVAVKKSHRQAAASLLKYASIGAICLAILPAAYLLGLRVTGNFHVVAEGSLYRSAQPSMVDLRHYTRDWGIQSVVNLRSDTHDIVEQNEASRLGVRYIHYPLAADDLWDASEITGVMKVLAEAPKPILIHGQFGADRTGLVSAIYLLTVARKSATEAWAQLSPRYGHLPYLGSPTTAMDSTSRPSRICI